MTHSLTLISQPHCGRCVEQVDDIRRRLRSLVSPALPTSRAIRSAATPLPAATAPAGAAGRGGAATADAKRPGAVRGARARVEVLMPQVRVWLGKSDHGDAPMMMIVLFTVLSRNKLRTLLIRDSASRRVCGRRIAKTGLLGTLRGRAGCR